MKAISQYISKLPKKKHLNVVKGNLDLGAKVYHKCLACHGKKAEGSYLKKAPALVHFEDWYLVQQLQNFKSGRRGGHPKDSLSQSMVNITKGLSDTELPDVTVYIKSLNVTKD
jgi:cytochrome c553